MQTRRNDSLPALLLLGVGIVAGVCLGLAFVEWVVTSVLFFW